MPSVNETIPSSLAVCTFSLAVLENSSLMHLYLCRCEHMDTHTHTHTRTHTHSHTHTHTHTHTNVNRRGGASRALHGGAGQWREAVPLDRSAADPSLPELPLGQVAGEIKAPLEERGGGNSIAYNS